MSKSSKIEDLFHLRTVKECVNRNKYRICISCSLFKMKNSYRDFSKYVNYFFEWIEIIPRDAFVRMYVDESVLNDPNFLKIFDSNIDYLEIIVFECQKFLTDDKKFHDGTFGSIARFLTWEDKDLLKSKNLKYIWISDLDLSVNYFDNGYILDMGDVQDTMGMKREHIFPISIMAMAYYTSDWNPNENEYTPLGGHIIINVKKVDMGFSKISEFLLDVLDDKYSNIKNKITQKNLEILNSLSDKSESKEKVRRKYESCLETKRFTYGFDELYINLYFTPILNDYDHLVYMDFNLKNLRNLRNVKRQVFDNLNRLHEKLYNVYPYDKSGHLSLTRQTQKDIEDFYEELDKISDYVKTKYTKEELASPRGKDTSRALQIYKSYKNFDIVPFFLTGVKRKVYQN